ncbi:MAG: ubiquitin carboxyl-terminal hydrolase family protein [Chlamydiota bacterium]
MSSVVPVTGKQAAVESCVQRVKEAVHDVQKKVLDLCSADCKVHSLLIFGRVLQAAAVASLVFSSTFVFSATITAIFGAAASVALFALGHWIAENPNKIYDNLMIERPFCPGQPIGLVNTGNNCWLNASLQLILNIPEFQNQIAQCPHLTNANIAYNAAGAAFQKVCPQFDSQKIRENMSRESNLVSAAHQQEDAGDFFHYYFEGHRANHVLLESVNNGVATIRRDSLFEVNLVSHDRANFQQLFNREFDCMDDSGQRHQLTFVRAPDNLLVQAKRFTQTRDPADGTAILSKNNEAIDITESLNLEGRFVQTGQDVSFRCNGFVVHSGTSLGGGHYVAYIKKGDTWWYCSDSTVREVSLDDAHNAMKHAYILHYRKN